jgi:hypothetical protein
MSGEWKVGEGINRILDDASRKQKMTMGGRLERLDVAELLARPAPPIEWLWDGYVERGTVCQLHGSGGAGKSLLALALARAIAEGNMFLGRGTWPGHVIVIDGENPDAEVHRRLERFCVAPVAGRIFYWQATTAIFDDLDAAEEALCAHTGMMADLILLDSQRALWPGDENDAAAVRQLYMMLRRVASTTACAILVLHHDNKAGGYSGSSDLNANVDSRLHLVRDEDGSVVLAHEKLRSDTPQEPVRYRLDLIDGVYAFTLEQLRTVRGEVEAALTDEWQTATEISRAAGLRREDVERELWALTRSGDAEHAHGPPGRHPKAKCWRTRPKSWDKSGQVARGDQGDYLSHGGYTPVGGAPGTSPSRGLVPERDNNWIAPVDHDLGDGGR